MFLKDSGILRRARRVTKTSSWVLFLSHEVVVMPSTGVISTVRVVHGSIAFFTAIDEITFVSVPVFVEEYTLPVHCPFTKSPSYRSPFGQEMYLTWVA